MMIIITLRKSLIYKENNADFYEFALFFISAIILLSVIFWALTEEKLEFYVQS